MRRVLAIARLNILELTRDRTELVSVIVLPLLLTWVFGTAFGSAGVDRAIEIPVADLDGSDYSQALVVLVDESAAFETAPVSEAEARRLVGDGDVPVVVIVPAGFGDDLEAGRRTTIEALRYPGSAHAQAAAEVVEGAARRIAANVSAARFVAEDVPGVVAGGADGPAREERFRDAYAFADGLWEPEPPVGVRAEVVSASEQRAAEMEAPANTQYSLGFTVFFVFMTALGSAGGVLEDRELGTLRRILAAPARRAEVLSGKVVGVALVAAFEAAILVAFGALVFGVPWGSEPAAVAIMLAALVLSATGLGVMVSALVRTRSQMSALTPVLATGLAMLGGCYWPLEITSPFMQRLAMFTPTGWAMVGLKDVVARGMGIEAVLLPAAVLIGFSALTIAVGVTRLRLE